MAPALLPATPGSPCFLALLLLLRHPRHRIRSSFVARADAAAMYLFRNKIERQPSEATERSASRHRRCVQKGMFRHLRAVAPAPARRMPGWPAYLLQPVQNRRQTKLSCFPPSSVLKSASSIVIDDCTLW